MPPLPMNLRLAPPLLLMALAYAPTLMAQTWTSQDSARLHQWLQDPERGSPRLESPTDSTGTSLQLRGSMNKPWLDFDVSLPATTHEDGRTKTIITLFPYTANTPYDWDPIRQRKIKIDEYTWRNDPFYKYYKRLLPIYAHGAPRPTGSDFMKIFTKDFWDFKGKKRRERTREVLKNYGDSLTAKFPSASATH